MSRLEAARAVRSRLQNGSRLRFRQLSRRAETHGLPEIMVIDEGSEFTSRAFLGWAEKSVIDLRFIDPRNPVDNADAESFNATVRRECLSQHWFRDLGEAREILEWWKEE